MMSDAQLVSTGVAELDAILGGGIPSRQVLLVAGSPGSGKTILAGQIGFAAAARGQPVVLATAASEPHSKLIESLQGFGFFQRQFLGREIILLSVYPWLRKGARETREMLLSSVRERHARLLVIDGLRSLHDVWRDASVIREFLAEVGVGLATSDCTGVFTLECAADRVLETAEAATVDGVVALHSIRAAMRSLRRVEVVKVRGRPHVPGEHVARLEPSGFRVAPRIDAWEPPERAPIRHEGRARFGIPGIDAWLEGGLPGGGATLIVGDGGTGKTLIATAFAWAGASSGESTLLASLEEDPESLLSRARGVGMDISGGRALSLWSPSAIAHEPDEIARKLLERSATLNARRVVVDGVDALEERLEAGQRRAEFFEALVRQLRAGGGDVLFTSARAESSPSPLGRAVDNLLELRLERRGAQLHRELWALKVRWGYSPREAWRFTISARSGISPEAAAR